MRYLFAVVLVMVMAAVTACPSGSRMPYKRGMSLLQDRSFGEALEQFELSLEADPEQRMALFQKARCLYELERFEEALPVFEEFLTRTYDERNIYRDERSDSEFYRDKCKIELGIEVPQDPHAIPPERMGG